MEKRTSVRTTIRRVGSEKDIRDALAELYAAWCERKSLNALQALLPARSCWLATSEGWHQLLGFLKDARGVQGQDITEQERMLIDDLILAVEAAIHKT